MEEENWEEAILIQEKEVTDDGTYEVGEDYNIMYAVEVDNSTAPSTSDTITVKIENDSDPQSWFCSSCNKSFPSEFEANTHYAANHSSILNDHDCPACDLTFQSETELQLHAMESHQVILQYKCDICDLKLATQKALEEHRKHHTFESRGEHSGKKRPLSFKPVRHCSVHVCGKCTQPFDRKSALMEHIKKKACRSDLENFKSKNETKTPPKIVDPKKRAKRKIPCNLCRKWFIDEEAKSQHCKEEHANVTCEMCGQMFSDNLNLTVHFENEHNIVKKPKHPCSMCTKMFSIEESINHHLNKEHQSKPLCVRCPLIFKTKHDRNHFKEYHLLMTCHVCNVSVGGTILLKIHMENEHSIVEKENILCQYCPKSFTSHVSHTYHLNIEHKFVRLYQCDICLRKFKNRSSLSVHKNLHFDVECELCGKHFKGTYNFRVHLENEHNIVQEENIRCAHCPRFFGSSLSYSYHMSKVHREVKRFKCQVCGKMFSDKSNLGHHRRTHDGRGAKGSIVSADCNICPRFFGSNRKNLVCHRENDHDVEREKVFECSFCPKYFSIKEAFSVHVHTEHLSIYNNCVLCPKKFATDRKITFRTSYLGIRCRECHKHLKCKADFLIHMELVHKIVYPVRLKCEECPMEFSCETTFRYHQIHDHNAIGDFECAKCLKRFLTKKKLTTHIKICYGLQPELLCSTCDEKFTTKKKLNEHEETHEVEDQTYLKLKNKINLLSCFCGRKFVKQVALDKHYITHTGSSYKCEVCAQHFVFEKNLQKHMERHENREYMCGQCQKCYKTEHALTKHMFTHYVKVHCAKCNKEHYFGEGLNECDGDNALSKKVVKKKQEKI